MYTSRAKPGWHVIDGMRIHVDSDMEAIIIRSLIKKYGFSGKWARPYTGIEFGKNRYTPDLELSIDDNGASRRAIVELKPISATELSIVERERASAAMRYYSGAILLLYVHKTDRWYKLDPITKHVIACPPPKPSLYTLDAYPKPVFAIPSINRFARLYRGHGPARIATVLADSLDFGIRIFFDPAKKSRKRKRK